MGHPWFAWALSFIAALHSCSAFFEHTHQTFRPLPDVTLSGLRFPFRVGCHSCSRLGNSLASELCSSTFVPEQYGQPLFLPCRFPIVAFQTCDALVLQRHQTNFLLNAVTFCGVRSPFLSWHHSSANWGFMLASELPLSTLLPVQNGHPLPKPFLLLTEACQTCSGLVEHRHHASFFEFA